ncbi:MAG: SCP2 sterol-binding domain-containing protein [Solirubrobacteraceae bacterium]
MDAEPVNGGSENTEAVAAIDPALFATLVRDASDDQLREGLAANRQLILGEIFRRMPEQFDPQRAGDVNAVVEWRILERPGGGYDAWHLILGDDQCRLAEGSAEDPTVTYEINPVDFIRLITDNASGPKLFLFGRLKITGNLLLAARMPGFFRIPGADS